MALKSTIKRRDTRPFTIGSGPRQVEIGGMAPITIQSMTTTDSRQVNSTLDQIKRLAKAGCEIVRVAIPDEESARALSQIVSASPIPVIADIHFDYQLAILSMNCGADAIRINPGNIGREERVSAIIEAAKSEGRKRGFLNHAPVPIRIGVNAGSLEKDLLSKYGRPSPEALVESALRWLSFFDQASFTPLKVSIKSSSVSDTIKAHRLLADRTTVPFHIGLTEAGPIGSGSIKSAIALGALLTDGIGDTIRVSLAAEPETEIPVAKQILQAAGVRQFGANIIACPQCARCHWPVGDVASAVETRLAKPRFSSLTVAIMGCAVNGPGEAREADLGLAGGLNDVLLFHKGKIIDRIQANTAIDRLVMEAERLCPP